MKLCVSLLLSAAIAAAPFLVGVPGRLDAAQGKADQAVVDGQNAFALDLYANLRKQKGNVFFSPYSISTALAMTYAGAKGDTAADVSIED